MKSKKGNIYRIVLGLLIYYVIELRNAFRFLSFCILGCHTILN